MWRYPGIRYTGIPVLEALAGTVLSSLVLCACLIVLCWWLESSHCCTVHHSQTDSAARPLCLDAGFMSDGQIVRNNEISLLVLHTQHTLSMSVISKSQITTDLYSYLLPITTLTVKNEQLMGQNSCNIVVK